jgi:hypothetical protein
MMAPPDPTFGGRIKEPLDAPSRVILFPCVLSFPFLFTPRAGDKDDPTSQPKYQTECWFYQDDPSYQMNLGAMNYAIAAVIKAKWPDPRKVPNFQHQAIRLLSGKPENIRPDREGVYINAKSGTQPEIKCNVAPPGAPFKLESVVDQRKVYPGVIACVTVNFYDYDKKGGKGVGVALNNIILLKDGPRLAGGVRPAEEELGNMLQQLPFGELGGAMSGDAAAAMAYDPSAGYMPQQQPLGIGYNPQQPQMPPGYPQQPQGYPQPNYPQQPQMPPQGYPQQPQGYPPQQQGYPQQQGWQPTPF